MAVLERTWEKVFWQIEI